MAVTGSAESEAYKALFNKAYGEAAELAKTSKGDPIVARTLMRKLGYTREELDTAGDDVARMQGVQSPHAHAKIKPGERVLDLGCGLGVDALIAAAAAGPGGKVCGVDLSSSEVAHARKAHAARLTKRHSGGTTLAPCSYHVGDMEMLPFPDESFDVVISNGGFCLVPDKKRAFEEVHRVLKPGGRCAIACTVNKEDLDPAVKWPACMEVFMTVGDAAKLVGGAGLDRLEVRTDRTGGRMDVFDIEVDEVATEIETSGDGIDALTAAAPAAKAAKAAKAEEEEEEQGSSENETLYANADAAADAEIAALEAALEDAKVNGCSHAVGPAERRLREARSRLAKDREQRDRARTEADAEIAKLEAEADRLAAAEASGGGCSHARKAAERRLREAIGRRERKAAAKVGVHWGDPDFDHLHAMDINTVSARVVIVAARPPTGSAAGANSGGGGGGGSGGGGGGVCSGGRGGGASFVAASPLPLPVLATSPLPLLLLPPTACSLPVLLSTGHLLAATEGAAASAFASASGAATAAGAALSVAAAMALRRPRVVAQLPEAARLTTATAAAAAAMAAAAATAAAVGHSKW